MIDLSENNDLNSSSPTHLYIHIPFCRHRCGYCAFAVDTRFANDLDFKQQYLNHCFQELDHQRLKMDVESIRTLYIGGGTPSRLSNEQIHFLFKGLAERFPNHVFEEITFELNPEDLIERPELVHIMNQHGVTRCSLGTQTTSPEGLDVLERAPTPQQVKESLAILKQDFQGSISLDLIIGWPGQTLDMLIRDDLPFIQEAQPDHLSIYLINIEPGTRLHRDIKKGRCPAPDDDVGADLWEGLTKFMLQEGYDHYEISNFCRPRHDSLHNTLTWRGEPYLGIGCGAVSRVGDRRWKNMANPVVYGKQVQDLSHNMAEVEVIDTTMRWQELLLLSCRHREGLSLTTLSQALGRDCPKSLLENIQLGIDEGDLQLREDHLQFTSVGWSRFDAWISSWMALLEDDLSASTPSSH